MTLGSPPDRSSAPACCPPTAPPTPRTGGPGPTSSSRSRYATGSPGRCGRRSCTCSTDSPRCRGEHARDRRASHHLLTNTGALDQVRADPALLARAIQESLRLEPAATRVDRYATTDAELAGARIQAGDLVIVCLS